MTRYKVTCRCNDCGTVFSRVLKSESAPNPKCPNRSCRKEQRERGLDLTKAQAPAAVGSVTARAVDTTAEIVMQDHGLSDLRDNVRQGETSTPKLAPNLQHQVDNFFNPSGLRKATGINGAALAQQAMAGAFTSKDAFNPMAGQHAARTRPPVRIVAGDRKER